VRTDVGGRICEIGKLLPAYDAVDTGVFLCTPALFDAIEGERDARGDCSLSDGVARVARGGRALAVGIPDQGRGQDVDNAADLDRAERLVLRHEAAGVHAAGTVRVA